MPVLSNLIVRIGASTDDFDKQVDRSLNKVKRFAADASAAGQALAIGFSAPILAAGGFAVKAAADMEVLSKGLTATMKSASGAAEEMTKLKEIAKLPGIGLEEAVRGSIRLQTLGSSADQSRRIMLELGNALAVVGGGKEDFGEAIRQLSQMAAVGKVTKENLDPIVERIPQIAAIIKEKFGPQALGDPAKTFAAIGMSAQQFIDVIVNELARGERAGNSYQNSWENIQMAAQDAAAEFGKTLLPIAQRVLDDFLTPGIEKVKSFAQEFQKLPKSTQDFAIELTAIATAAPLVIVALGTIAEKALVLYGVLNRSIPLLARFAGFLQMLPGWGKAAALGIAALALSIDRIIDKSKELAIALDPKRATGADYELISVISGQYREMDDSLRALVSTSGGLGSAPSTFQILADAMKSGTVVNGQYRSTVLSVAESANSATGAIERKTKAHIELKVATLDNAIAQKMAKEYLDSYNQAIERAAELGIKYGGVTRDQIALNIQVADTLFRYFRILENPPDVKIPGIGGGMKDVPRPDMPTFPGEFAEFEKTAQNVWEKGMQTRQQYDAMAQAARQSAKNQSAAMRQVSTVLTDLSRGITDVIFKGGNLAKMFQDVAMQAAQSITRLLIEGALKKLQDKLFEVGGVAGKVFGGGTGTIMSAAPGAAKPAISGGGGMGGAVGAASGGVMGAVTMVSGIVSAVSGVIGNFQMAGMNKTLDLIEKEVRYSQIHLLYLLEKNNEYLPKLKDIWESLIRMETRQMAVAGAGNVNITINSSGGDPRAMLNALTRELKQLGVIPR